MAGEACEVFSRSSSSTPRDGLTPVVSDWSFEPSPATQRDSPTTSSPTPFESYIVSLDRPNLSETTSATCKSSASIECSQTPLLSPALVASSQTSLLQSYSPVSDSSFPDMRESESPVSDFCRHLRESDSSVSDLCLPAHLFESDSRNPVFLRSPALVASSRTPLLTPVSDSSCPEMRESESPVSDFCRHLRESDSPVSDLRESDSPVSDLCLPAHLFESDSRNPVSVGSSPTLRESYNPEPFPYFSSSDSPASITSSLHEHSPATPSSYMDLLSSTCKWTLHQSGVPFFLKDICMLHVLFRVEEFPVESLAVLPRVIRRRLLNGLSHADVLHLGTALFSDLNVLDPFRKDYEQRGHTVAHEKFLEVILACGDLKNFLSLNLEPAVLDCFHYYKPKFHLIYNKFSFFEHISKSLISLKSTLVPSSFETGVILPQRFLPLLNISNYSGYISRTLQFLPHLAWPLLRYCNMHCAPKELKIDCYTFQKTVFWKKYKKTYTKKLSLLHQKNCPVPNMDPVIPFIQEFLSGVEVLELGTHYTKRALGGMNEAMSKVPYVILYNIVTSSQPHLKHLKVYGIPMLTVWLLEAIAELVCDDDSKFDSYMLPLASPKPEPYRLEGLSIVTVQLRYNNQPFDYTTGSCAYHLASISQSVVELQMQTLRSVTIQDLGFCYSDEVLFSDTKGVCFSERNVNVHIYTTLLSWLNRFLKQPQFEVLSIDKSPFRAACELIVTFLTTPATHEQSFSIESKEELENSPIVSDKEEADDDGDSEIKPCIQTIKENAPRKRHDQIEVYTIPPKKARVMKQNSPIPISHPSQPLPFTKRFDMIQTYLYQIPSPHKIQPNSLIPHLLYPSQPLPETNAQYKCLDLGLSSSGLHSWLFSLPELKLKKLTIRTQDMTVVPADMVIQVEHVAFTSQVDYKAYYSYTTPYTYITPIMPTITYAHLEKFLVSNSLLKRLEFTTPVGRSTPGLLPALNHCLSVLYQQGRGLEEIILNLVEFDNVDDMKEFFIRVRDLSHSYGTTLVMSSENYQLVADRSQEEVTSLFVDLSKQFQEKKIKKIVFTARDNNETDSLLELLTEEMDFYRKFSFCTENSGIINNTVLVL